MYCFQCGAAGAVAFCPACGQDQLASRRSVANETNTASIHWTDSIDYETIIAHPDVRSRLGAIRPCGMRGLSGEDLLSIFDAVSPIGFSLGKLTTAILPIYDKLGIKTDYQSEALCDAPTGRVMLAVLSSLAIKSLAIAEVQQGETQCLLISDIPAGLITNRGRMNILLEKENALVRVSMASTISAQWYDWGKSKNLQQSLFDEIRRELLDQGFGQEPAQRIA
ncbi:hypothetical protein Q31b_10270 [Novipirellula aureliae]|uniref:Uncharacterized protein n=1 Tax=Novipirellula aureliae TaxID=2527966 RepID=A0A5C6EDP9_9BACT|nr:hypothetical protein [Novipirellula aureliae]TWU45851.1 hypothetical protein Q31b_10270 [Novipirellula aureliae]